MDSSKIDKLFGQNDLTPEEYSDRLAAMVGDILEKRFPDDRRRQNVRRQSNRLNLCCPVCGDSMSDPSKKRANIGLSGRFANLYKCFNCGVSMSVTEFLKKYGGGSVPLDIIDYVTANKPADGSMADSSVGVSIEIYDQAEADKFAFRRETFKSLLQLEEAAGNKADAYLKSRMQFDRSRFLYSVKKDELYILNLTKSGRILGVQTRSLKTNRPKNEPKYRTFNLTNIYGMMMKGILSLNVAVPPEIDTLSMVFNSLTVDYTKPVIVTEGPLDAFLIKNAIALCGAAKTMPFMGDFRWLFDDDDTGRAHAIDKIKDGGKVFLWNMFRRENGIPDAKKWDVNDVVKWAAVNRDAGYINFYDKKYWSDGLFDIVSI